MALILNENQQAAVNWNDGPLLVLAGPGSGKTTVLTQRIIRLIKESPDQRYRILALTFTQNAARNMRSKIDEAVSEGRGRVYLNTFHSFSADVIRQHGALEGIRTDFNIMTTDLDQEGLLFEVIQEGIEKGYDFRKEDIRYKEQIKSFLVQCLILPEEPKPDSELNKARYLFYHYVLKMKDTGRLDYEGMLYFAWILLTRKQVQKHYSIVYKYICVDEYQDTNFSQYNLLIKLLKDDAPNLFVVADDDQIIYQWNGASPERLNSIIKEYNMNILQLPENYRCPGEVVAVANKMIKYNKNRYNAKEPGISLTHAVENTAVILKQFETFDDEVLWIINDIRNKSRKSPDTKIMGRTHKLLKDTQNIFMYNGLYAVIHQRKSEFESFQMRFLHSLLRLFSARGDKVYLQRLFASFYQIEGINIDYHEVIGQSSFTGGDLLKAWIKMILEHGRVSKTTKKFVEKIINDNFYIDYENLIEITIKWLDSFDVSMDKSPDEFDNYISEREIFNRLCAEIESVNPESLSLSAFLQELDLRDKSEPVPNDAFELITIHGSKGLEFKHVYLIGMVDDFLPSYNSIKKGANPNALEEERRSCYVAITRTQKTLTMTYSSQYGNWTKEPSRFLKEMGLLI
ncbi:MAG: ATP-dependent helicase [Bacteroidales bacterium]|jgi:DNA helicase-2/ATP-dependent DNA helicase PcrA|nr:ATP-dependent helicase [Bacteroidales bacterium]